jgi:hypothetical protein
MSGPPASSSVVPSAFTSAPATVSASEQPVYFAAGSIRDLIVIALGIPAHLIDRKKGGDIRVAYAKYLALLDALDKLSTMSASGAWKHNNTNDDVVEVFVSKSVYFRNHAKVFPLLVHYPAMQQWLENAAGAPSDSVVWGNEKHSFDGLDKILTAKQKGKGKGKGKGKEVHRDDSPPLSIPVVKKTATKKDKRKEVIHNKKGNSSKGRHGHD